MSEKIAIGIKVVKGGIWLSKKLPFINGTVRRTLQSYRTQDLQQLHTGVLHKMRRLAVNMDRNHWRHGQEIVAMAVDLCTEMRIGMCRLLDLPENDLHCCLKLLVPPENEQGVPQLLTWAVSRPFDDRPKVRVWPVKEQDSTIYAALCGCPDGYHCWRRFPAFCCNDLLRHADKFKNPRQNWQIFYRSSLVFPLRFVRNPDENDFDDMGVLAFDSPKVGAFPDVPEIFQYRDNPSEYRNQLERSAAFHLGAVFADSFSAHMHSVYSRLASGNDHAIQEAPTDENSPLDGAHGQDLPDRSPGATSLPIPKPGQSQ